MVAKLPKTKKGKAKSEFVQAPLAKLSANPILPPLAAKIPWTHYTIILDRTYNEAERLFYLQKTVENGRSKSVLSLQIDNKLFERQGKAISNFENTLPPVDSDLARETFMSS